MLRRVVYARVGHVILFTLHSSGFTLHSSDLATGGDPPMRLEPGPSGLVSGVMYPGGKMYTYQIRQVGAALAPAHQ